jgi:hypothetical protein
MIVDAGIDPNIQDNDDDKMKLTPDTLTNVFPYILPYVGYIDNNDDIIGCVNVYIESLSSLDEYSCPFKLILTFTLPLDDDEGDIHKILDELMYVPITVILLNRHDINDGDIIYDGRSMSIKCIKTDVWPIIDPDEGLIDWMNGRLWYVYNDDDADTSRPVIDTYIVAVCASSLLYNDDDNGDTQDTIDDEMYVAETNTELKTHDNDDTFIKFDPKIVTTVPPLTLP